jgi:general secretion pathway protein G
MASSNSVLIVEGELILTEPKVLYSINSPQQAHARCRHHGYIKQLWSFQYASMRKRSGISIGADGFTLVEIMVVIVILGVLAALVVPRVIGRADEARAVAVKQDIASIMQALKLYHLDNARYPTTEQGLQALVTKPALDPQPGNWKPYLDRLPKDAWGKPYQYLNPGIRGEIDVFSLGADGQPGGNGNDTDIGSWDL